MSAEGVYRAVKEVTIGFVIDTHLFQSILLVV